MSGAAPAGGAPLPGLGGGARDLIARVIKLEQQGELEAALALLQPRLVDARAEPDLLKAGARLLLALNRPAEAQALLNGLKPAPDDAEQWALRAAAAQQESRFDEAMDYAARYCALAPVVITNSKRQDLPVVGILSSGPTTIHQPFTPNRLHFRENFISQYARRNLGPFRLLSLFVEVETAARAQEIAPKPSLVLNGMGTGELFSDRKFAGQARKAIRRWGVDVLNPPEIVARTARDKLSQALAGEPRVRVPRIEYFNADATATDDLMDRLERDFGFPVILRAPFVHMGEQAFLANSRQEAGEIAGRLAPGFYAIEFIDNQPRPSLHRRIRAGIIDGKIHLLRLDYDAHWNVHGNRHLPERISFYQPRPELIDEEKKVCADPNGELGEGVMSTLARIAEIVKLDWFGIDFDIDADGRVIVFEANPAMLLLTSGNAQIQRPKEPEVALIETFNAMLSRRIG